MASETTTTTNNTDATAQAINEMTERLKAERLLAQQNHSHAVRMLSSLEELSQAAFDMADEIEQDTPIDEVRQKFMSLSNWAAQAMVGHVWATRHSGD